MDVCENNFHNCHADAPCTKVGPSNSRSFKCVCPDIQFGDWLIEADAASTGEVHSWKPPCYYYHPEHDNHRLQPFNYAGRDTIIHYGTYELPTMYDFAVKCRSLGMKLFTPENEEENSYFYQLEKATGAHWDSVFPLGIYKHSDGYWGNIYTGEKLAWQKISTSNSGRINYASAYYSSQGTSWKITGFNIPEFEWDGDDRYRIACIPPKDGESIEIFDFCATGLHNCDKNAICINGGESDFTCECQPLQFGDIQVPGTGTEDCIYKMPGHDDKTLSRVRLHDGVYAFHFSSEKHSFADAVNYCAALGMHLPIPNSEIENEALLKLQKYRYNLLLGFSLNKAGKHINIYTGEELSYTNWDYQQDKITLKYDNQPRYTTFDPNDFINVLLDLDDVDGWNKPGFWNDYKTSERKLQIVYPACQKSDLDVVKVDWCKLGFHNCHADANCLLTNDEKLYKCECKDPEFYTGNGVGKDGCVFKLGSKFLIDNYNVDVTINDRYVRTQIAVSIQNNNPANDALYKFGVNLDQYEFISSLTMRVGDDGKVLVGGVHKELEVEEIFNAAVSNESGGTASTANIPTENDASVAADTPTGGPAATMTDTTFAIKVKIPVGKKLYIWLNYDKQLTRENGLYAYPIKVFPNDPVTKMSVSVTIEESLNLDAKKTSVYWESEGKPEGRLAARNQENAFGLNKISDKKWEFTFEKDSISQQEWKDNLKIEYDLDRSDNTCGDIVMRDGYFIHHIAPKDVGSIPKNVIISIDTSTSMNRSRLRNVKTAIIAILDTLTEQDTFWLQHFSSASGRVWSWETVQATAENLQNAKSWVNSLSTGYQTYLYNGLSDSVKRPADSNRANIAFIISDGYPTGTSKWEDIQAGILDKNSIKNSQGDVIGQKWAVFSFSIGYAAPMFELNKLSTWNMGVGQQVLDDNDINAQLTSFFNKYSNAFIWNNQFRYNGASEYDCSATNLYADQELTCIGKLPSSKQCGEVDDLGFTPGNSLLADENMMNVSILN